MINYQIHNLQTDELIIKQLDKKDIDLLYQFGKVSGLDNYGFNHFKSKEDLILRLDEFLYTNYLKIQKKDKIIGLVNVKEIDNEISLSLIFSLNERKILTISNVIRELTRFFILDINKDNIYLDTNDSLIIEALVKNKYNLVINKYVINKKTYISTIERIKMYDENLEEIKDRYILRGQEANYKNIYRGVADIIIYNTNTKRFLVTRRAKDKKTHPNMLEVTGGAISYNETEGYTALREVKEETGLDIDSLKFLYKIHNNTKDRLGYMVIYYVFFAKTSAKEDDVILQEGETINYYWYSFNDFIKVIKSSEFNESKYNRIKAAIDLIRKEI